MVSRSALFRRAWQLARLNRASALAPLDFARWLRFAWAELKAGHTSGWTAAEPDPIASARERVAELERATRLGNYGLKRLYAAARELASAERHALLVARFRRVPSGSLAMHETCAELAATGGPAPWRAST